MQLRLGGKASLSGKTAPRQAKSEIYPLWPRWSRDGRGRGGGSRRRLWLWGVQRRMRVRWRRRQRVRRRRNDETVSESVPSCFSISIGLAERRTGVLGLGLGLGNGTHVSSLRLLSCCHLLQPFFPHTRMAFLCFLGMAMDTVRFMFLSSQISLSQDVHCSVV